MFLKFLERVSRKKKLWSENEKLENQQLIAFNGYLG